MKENKYDEQIFFMKYSEMDCSKKGLEGGWRMVGIEEDASGF